MPTKSPHSLVVSISIFFFFSVSCLAEIRYTEVPPNSEGDLSPIAIDTFGFTQNGRLELNLSRISIAFSNPNPNFNFSQIGFFFAARLSSIDNTLLSSRRCYLHSNFTKLLYTFEPGLVNNKELNLEFSVTDADAFNLHFQNCLPQKQLGLSMVIQSAMYNVEPETGRRNYLSAGKNSLFGIYFIYMCIYLAYLASWIHTLQGKSSRWLGVIEIDHVMMYFAVFKVLMYVIELAKLYHIKHIGYAQSLVGVLFICISTLFGGTFPLFVLVFCIGSGWPFLIPILQEKYFLVPIISARSIFNILTASLVIRWYSKYTEIVTGLVVFSRIVDFVSFVALLYPITWTTTHLLEAGQVDGKATLSFAKVKLFRRLFRAVLFYNFTSMPLIIVFEIYSLLTKYFWTGILAEESTILAMYVFLVYRFCPMTHTQIVLINNDEEIAAAEALQDRSYDLQNRMFL